MSAKMRNTSLFFIILIFFSQCERLGSPDYSNPDAVLTSYRQYSDDWDMMMAYKLLADTCKSYISESDYLSYFERPDSVARNQLFYTTGIEQIPMTTDNDRYRRYQVHYEVVDKLLGDTLASFWKYTMIKEKDQWKLAWTEPLVSAANYELGEGNYEKAASLFGAIIYINPFDEMAYQGMATCYLFNNQTTRAVSFAQRAINIDPENEDNYRFLSELHAYAGQYDLSVGALYSAIKINPRPDYFIRMGNQYKEMGMYSKADSVYDICIERNNDATVAWWMKGDLYYHYMDRKEAARQYYETALKKPAMSDFMQAQLYFGYGMMLANEISTKGVQASPDEKVKAFKESRDYISKALQIDSQNVAYREFLQEVENEINGLQ